MTGETVTVFVEFWKSPLCLTQGEVILLLHAHESVSEMGKDVKYIPIIYQIKILNKPKACSEDEALCLELIYYRNKDEIKWQLEFSSIIFWSWQTGPLKTLKKLFFTLKLQGDWKLSRLYFYFQYKSYTKLCRHTKFWQIPKRKLPEIHFLHSFFTFQCWQSTICFSYHYSALLVWIARGRSWPMFCRGYSVLHWTSLTPPTQFSPVRPSNRWVLAMVQKSFFSLLLHFVKRCCDEPVYILVQDIMHYI